MNLTAYSSNAAKRLRSGWVLAVAISLLVIEHPASANDDNHPIHSQVYRTATTKKMNSIDAAAHIFASQARQNEEPGIGAAIPTAAASYGTITAAEVANAQLVAAALAQGAKGKPAIPQTRAPIAPSIQHLDTARTNQEIPKVVVHTEAAPSMTSDSSGLTINIALPLAVLKTDETGNLQPITINLSFPDAQK